MFQTQQPVAPNLQPNQQPMVQNVPDFDFDAEEETNGVRFSWNIFPSSRIDAEKLAVPVGVLYTPLTEYTTLVQYPPVQCRGQQNRPCRTILNPQCKVDFKNKLWNCPFCSSANPLPNNYAQITPENLPAELMPQYSTIEYLLAQNAGPLTFLFVVDLCLRDEELNDVKASLIQSLSLMPQGSMVGLITFGKAVQLYELGFEGLPKSYVFNGAKDLPAKTIQAMLGFQPRVPNRGPQVQAAPRTNRFLMPIEDAEITLTNILEELQKDPYRYESQHRPLRATGTALSIAAALLEVTATNNGARIMCFTGGPCTTGPGQIASDTLKEPIRSHNELIKGTAKFTRKAITFYESLAKRVIESGHCVDLFCCSLDQVGVFEMQSLIKATGGAIVLADSFQDQMFSESFKKLFTADSTEKLPFGFNASLEINCSVQLKCKGLIGPGHSLARGSPSVSENEIGMGKTCAWRFGVLDRTTTLAFYFDIVNPHNTRPSSPALLQFLTQYQNAHGQRILRVTTTSREFADLTSQQYAIAKGFDQEASAVLVSRHAVYRAAVLGEEPFDILRWLDKNLIRWSNRFGDFQKEDPNTFALAENFSIFPQFMFHLRRSPFLQVFNNSPDETAFFRYHILKENVTNALIMVQPTLESYSFEGPPQPVLLASTSVRKDVILVLDTFFRLVIHYGETIAQWKKEKYHLDPKHENFKLLLEAPEVECQAILKKRFPLPRFVMCDQHSSQARFVLATIDPVVTHASGDNQGGEVVFTDDVNMHVFMEHLKKLAVTQ